MEVHRSKGLHELIGGHELLKLDIGETTGGHSSFGSFAKGSVSTEGHGDRRVPFSQFGRYVDK